jgi:hypothetical protein
MFYSLCTAGSTVGRAGGGRGSMLQESRPLAKGVVLRHRDKTSRGSPGVAGGQRRGGTARECAGQRWRDGSSRGLCGQWWRDRSSFGLFWSMVEG